MWGTFFWSSRFFRWSSLASAELSASSRRLRLDSYSVLSVIAYIIHSLPHLTVCRSKFFYGRLHRLVFAVQYSTLYLLNRPSVLRRYYLILSELYWLVWLRLRSFNIPLHYGVLRRCSFYLWRNIRCYKWLQSENLLSKWNEPVEQFLTCHSVLRIWFYHIEHNIFKQVTVPRLIF